MSSDAFQSRHNHFIDAIFSRINRIVADNFDPFVVRLAGGATKAEGEYKGATRKDISTSEIGGHKKLWVQK